MRADQDLKVVIDHADGRRTDEHLKRVGRKLVAYMLRPLGLYDLFDRLKLPSRKVHAHGFCRRCEARQDRRTLLSLVELHRDRRINGRQEEAARRRWPDGGMFKG